MIQCKDCEFYTTTPDGKGILTCNPFENIKEPECLQKWQMIKLDMLLAGQNIVLRSQNKMAPLQDKIMRYVEREIEELDESESWKYDPDENEDIDDLF